MLNIVIYTIISDTPVPPSLIPDGKYLLHFINLFLYLQWLSILKEMICNIVLILTPQIAFVIPINAINVKYCFVYFVCFMWYLILPLFSGRKYTAWHEEVKEVEKYFHQYFEGTATKRLPGMIYLCSNSY